MSNFEVPVELYMKSPVQSVSGADTLETARKRLEELRISSLAVVDDAERLTGVISMTDLIRVGLSLGAVEVLEAYLAGEILHRDHAPGQDGQNGLVLLQLRFDIRIRGAVVQCGQNRVGRDDIVLLPQ